MLNNFRRSLQHVLVHEGAWSDHPDDPGGATMKGVTLLTYRRHFGADRSKDDLKHIPDKQLEKIYRTAYWNQCRCDDLPAGLDYAVFDAAVNSGPTRSATWLQAVVGAKADGGIGPDTLAKIGEYTNNHSTHEVIGHICDHRLAFLKSLHTWPVFGTGWERRVEGVRTTANIMSGELGPEIEHITPSIDYQTVQKGSTGPWVIKLQHALNIAEDGKFGSDTQAALIRWQTHNQLEADGIAGRKTYQALGLLA